MVKALRLAVTSALLLFVGVTLGTLVAEEISRARATPDSVSTENGSGHLEDGDVAVGSAAVPDVSLPRHASDAAPEGDEAVSVSTSAPEVSSDPNASDEEDAVDVALRCSVRAFYFHNTHRCATCLKIEETAKSIMESEFAGAFAEGRLEWFSIDMEQERQYIAPYDLSMPTLVLARYVGGEEKEWVALGDTWALIRSDVRFSRYIENSVRAFFGACP